RPELLPREKPFAQEPEPRLEDGVVVLHLLRVPSGSDAEQKPSVREEIEARDRLRQGDGIVLDDETDARPELQGPRRRRRGHEPDERVERVGILLRQGTAARERRPAARW